MRFIQFSEYEDYVKLVRFNEGPGRFGEYKGCVVKRHADNAWRPIAWCDRCKADITSGLFFDEESGAALCSSCGGQSDKKDFASVGIIWDV